MPKSKEETNTYIEIRNILICLTKGRIMGNITGKEKEVKEKELTLTYMDFPVEEQEMVYHHLEQQQSNRGRMPE